MSAANGRHPAGNGGGPHDDGRNPRSGWGASRKGMDVSARIDADADLLVCGEAPPDAEPEVVELAAFARELRVAYARPPAEAVGELHVAAIVAEAAAASAGSPDAASRNGARAAAWDPPARRGRRLAFRLAAAGLATLLAATGLAVAGVKPPGPLGTALERVGVGVGDETAPPPDGDAGDASDAAGRGDVGAEGGEARDAGDASRGGRARGGDRAPAGAQGESRGEHGARARGDEGRSEGGTVNSAPGEATADQARAGRRPPQSPGRSGERAPAGPLAAPGPQAPGTDRGQAGIGDAEPRSGSKRELGQGVAEQGRAGGLLP